MLIDLDRLKSYVEESYALAATREYGDRGAISLRLILCTVHKLYRYVPADACEGPITVFHALTGGTGLPPAADGNILSEFSLLPQIVDSEGFMVQVLDNGLIRVWKQPDVDASRLSMHGIVYVYRDRRDSFWVKGVEKEFPNICPTHASMFSTPTFNDLDEALAFYGSSMVRCSSCYILLNAWDDRSRLFFKNKPERTMKLSLLQFLSSTLRNVDVQPEQNVDESHPVDIRVRWMFSTSTALIEIKWLGASKGLDGHITVRYSVGRAREGARQLADYLDKNRTRGPLQVAKGYLVIIDGRRRGLKDSTKIIDVENGLYFREKEVCYKPEYHRIRKDFHPPIRFFAEPICGP